jgi:opacity protein-like surface antigen
MSWVSLCNCAALQAAKHVRAKASRLSFAICVLLLTASSVERAVAADWPLRGSLAPTPAYARWDGWQLGVQAGFSNMESSSLNTTTGPVFGGFFGYNMQWDQLVLGFDLGYKYPSVLDTSTTTAQLKLVDYATLRGRAGYAIGQFLPYAVVGLAVGRFNYSDLNSATGTFAGKDNAFNVGIVAGLGVDWAVTPGAFLRAEWEYIAFAVLNGKTSQTNTGFLGVGVRF